MLLTNFKQGDATMSKKTTVSLTDVFRDGRSEEYCLLDALIAVRWRFDNLMADINSATDRKKDPLDPRFYWSLRDLMEQIERTLCESIVLACGEGPPRMDAMNDPRWLLSGPNECELVAEQDATDGPLYYGVAYKENDEGDIAPSLTVSA